MPVRPDARQDEMMPYSPGFPELLDEPVKPGPAPEEEFMGPGPEMIEEPPMPPPGMETAEEGQLPTSAAVVEIRDDYVYILDDMGESRRIPIKMFPVEPREGMLLSKAIVVDVADNKVLARVGDEQSVVEIPKAKLEAEFEVGDFFWMPEPPKPPEGIETPEEDEE